MDDIEYRFLEHVNNTGVTVFLINGVKLSGILKVWDENCLTLFRDGITQLIYRHSVATVVPDYKFGEEDFMGGRDE